MTLVRYTEQQSRELLQSYIFAGKYGPLRAPRGIEPELVSQFIREKLQPSSSADAYASVLELIRFYERADVLPHIRLALTGHEADATDLLRSAYALQAVGDLGSPENAAQAADYFDRVLVPHPALAARIYPALFDTLVALAPSGSPAQLAQRLAREVEKLAPGQHASEANMMAYDELAAVQRNNLPRTRILVETKKKLAAQPQHVRRAELVRIYLGLAAGGTMLGTWAARLLRKEAMDGDPEPVYAEFARGIDSIDTKTMGKERASFIIVRAAQAILYLQGTLSSLHRRVYEEAGGGGGMNFLWYDLPVLKEAQRP